MKRFATAVGLCVIVLAAGGCSRAAKEGAGIFLGASGSVTNLQGAPAVEGDASLADYQRFEISRFTDEMGGQVPATLFEELPVKFAKALASKKIPSADSGKTLLIRGKVLHYEDSSIVGKALGPVEFAVAKVEFVDKSTGTVLATANCVGRTGAWSTVGPARKAEGLAKAIVSWIDKRYPQDQRIKN